MSFRVALFDLDGTILDSAECGVLATQAAFLQCGYRVPEADEIIHWMGVPIEESFPALAREALTENQLTALLEDFRLRYRDLSDSHIRLFDGMLDLLARLNAAGITLAVVTSKHSHVALRNITSVGIHANFAVIVGPDMVQRCKPFADTVHKAMELLRLDLSEDVIVIGDTSYDIEMGKAANVSTCAVTWGAHSEHKLLKSEPTFLARTVDQLEQILQRA